MYFASHFHNFYHDAPVEAVERYVGELALWGINALMVWYDMHHFTGIDDPAAQAMTDLAERGSLGVGNGSNPRLFQSRFDKRIHGRSRPIGVLDAG